MPPSNDRPIALTIGTAGHVDHGKTTLVRHMTGTDTDRLEEEHLRGISIVPGYAELELPGGRRASLVDVPGHERFVKNMVAGSTGVDAFLLVVAADDGVMPQTREHLDVLQVLGVEQGVVALTQNRRSRRRDRGTGGAGGRRVVGVNRNRGPNTSGQRRHG